MFGDKLGLKHLLPIVSVTQHKRVSANVIAVRQGDPCKYIYFIKSGKFKMLRRVDFVKNIEEVASTTEDFYKEPTQEDYANNNVKNRLLEVDKLGKFYSFGDRKLQPEEEFEDETEPFTIVSVIPSEVYIVERNVFLQLLPKQFNLQFKTFPTDEQLRKRYYELRSWKVFKKKVFDDLILKNSTPTISRYSKSIHPKSKNEDLKFPNINTKLLNPNKAAMLRRESIFSSLAMATSSAKKSAAKASIKKAALSPEKQRKSIVQNSPSSLSKYKMKRVGTKISNSGMKFNNSSNHYKGSVKYDIHDPKIKSLRNEIRHILDNTH